jgi:hypothetical protein
VALARPLGRLLQAPRYRFAQAADMDRMVRDAKRRGDDCGDVATGPHLTAKAMGFGAPVQQLGQTGQLVGGPPARSPRGWPVVERLRPALAGAFQPLADSPLADAQGLGDLPLGPAFVVEGPRVKTSCCHPVLV